MRETRRVAMRSPNRPSLSCLIAPREEKGWGRCAMSVLPKGDNAAALTSAALEAHQFSTPQANCRLICSLNANLQLLEEEDSADEEFWGQEFFQEEKQDEEYTSESSVESVADTDFSASVSPFHSVKQRLHCCLDLLEAPGSLLLMTNA